MKWVRATVLALLVSGSSLLLTACPGSMPVMVNPPTEAEKANPKRLMEIGVNNVDAGIAAAAETLKNNRASFSGPEFSVLRERLKQMAGHSDAVSKFLEGGDLTSAEARLRMVETLLAEIRAELVKKANQ